LFSVGAVGLLVDLEFRSALYNVITRALDVNSGVVG
jgi:hypothetical protein